MNDERFNNLVHALQDGVAVTSKELGDEIYRIYGRNIELKQQVANLEEYMLKGVAFRDELQERIKRLKEALRGVVQWADPCWTGGYAGNPKTPHPAWGDVQEGRAALKSAREGEGK